MVNQEGGSVLVPVIQGYLQIMKCVASSMVSVTEVVQADASMDDLFDTCLSEEFVMAFERCVVQWHLKALMQGNSIFNIENRTSE
jgi:hypothetical protein